MRIMIISGEFPSKEAGGIASVVYNLCKEFEKRNFEYKLVCTKDFTFETDKGVFLDYWGIHPISDVIFGLSFRNLIKEEADKWDVFHFHLPNAQGPLIFSKNLKYKSVVTLHTTFEGYNKYVYRKLPFKFLDWRDRIFKLGYNKISSFLEKKSLKNAEKIIAVSSGLKDEIKSFYGIENVEVINNGIISSNVPIMRTFGETPKILYVGRLASQKGIFLGFKALKDLNLDFDFFVVGDGPLRNPLEKYCYKNDINVKFFGHINHENIYSFYSSADILLMPSLYEGFPMVALEGAASGLPIAAFKNARIEDIVCEENKDIICSTCDVNALKESICYLLENPSSRKRMGEKNRNKVLKEFSAKIMADKYIQIYREILS